MIEQCSCMERDAFHLSYLSDKIPEDVFLGQVVKTVAYLRVSTAQPVAYLPHPRGSENESTSGWLRSSFFLPLDPLQFFGNCMNAATGIEPDNDRVTPVGCQRELNPVDDALPSPVSPNQADRFADVQIGGLHAGRNRFVFDRYFLSGHRLRLPSPVQMPAATTAHAANGQHVIRHHPDTSSARIAMALSSRNGPPLRLIGKPRDWFVSERDGQLEIPRACPRRNV